MATQLPNTSTTTTDSPTAQLETELALHTDTRKPMRIGLWALGLGFGGFMLWAALAPLDEGVPTQGSVSLESKRQTVQHLSGGLISELLVGEGDLVAADQVLLRLDAAATRANFAAAQQRYMGLSAMESRILAEQSGAAHIAFAPEVMLSTDPMVQQQLATQQALLSARRAALAAELRAFAEAQQGQEAMLRAFAAQYESHSQRLASLNEELEGVRKLVAEGYAPRNRQLELERQVAATQGSLAELRGNSERSRRSIAELQNRAQQRRETQSQENESQLAQVRLELQASLERYRALTDELARTDVRAPVAGQVVGLSVHTLGGVIQPAQKLMDIVPPDEPLMLETRIPPHLINSVTPGQLADIRFNAFADSPALVVEGRLESVSADLITELGPAGEVTYFLGRVSVTPAGMQTLGQRQKRPGMPAEVIIKTGERSMLKYLLQPLTRRIAAAMTEE